MDFVALDVETANGDIGSICQIGLAGYRDGALVREWTSLVNPGEDFSYFNTRIHGLTADYVAGAPTWPELAEELQDWLRGQVAVCHTLFDQRALRGAWAKYGLAEPDCRWLDSCRLARQIWPKLERHDLATVGRFLGYEFRHHDALEDGKAAGAIVLAAAPASGLAAWLRRRSAKAAPDKNA